MQAFDQLAYPEQPMTGFAPYAPPKPATPTPTPIPTTKGKNPMGAPAIRNLSSVIRTMLSDIQKEAESLADELVSEATSFKQTIAEGRKVKHEIRDAHAEFKATLGLGTNGAEDDTPNTPPLDGQSPGSSAS